MSSPEAIGDIFMRRFGGDMLQRRPAFDDYKITHIEAESANRMAGIRAERASDIEIPPEIDRLIDNPMYRNAVRSRIKMHGLPYVRRCAELANTKAKPSHWFAKAVISAKNWREKTLSMLEALFHTEGIVLEAISGIGEKAEQFINYIIGSIGVIGMSTFMKIVRRARTADNPEHYMFGAIRQAIQQAKSPTPAL